jgi:hypothetical protein
MHNIQMLIEHAPDFGHGAKRHRRPLRETIQVPTDPERVRNHGIESLAADGVDCHRRGGHVIPAVLCLMLRRRVGVDGERVDDMPHQLAVFEWDLSGAVVQPASRSVAMVPRVHDQSGSASIKALCRPVISRGCTITHAADASTDGQANGFLWLVALSS